MGIPGLYINDCWHQGRLENFILSDDVGFFLRTKIVLSQSYYVFFFITGRYTAHEGYGNECLQIINCLVQDLSE